MTHAFNLRDFLMLLAISKILQRKTAKSAHALKSAKMNSTDSSVHEDGVYDFDIDCLSHKKS